MSGQATINPLNNTGVISGRSERQSVLAFIVDSISEQVVRESLIDLAPGKVEIRRGTVQTAISAMSKLPTPEVLIVDITGDDKPLQSLSELSEVVEPGVRVLVLGDNQEVDFYRYLTRNMGVAEYLFKPITRESTVRYFAPFITNQSVEQDTTRGGRVVAIIGARGGVGATSIAGNLAWMLGAIAKRHTVFMESDIYMGSGALLLGGKTGPGLRMALEMPDRIDSLFIERAVQPITERLSLLSSEEKLTAPMDYALGAARKLIDELRTRYNFIIIDVPFMPNAYNRELIDLAHHRVIVMDPSLASVRDARRLLGLPNGQWQPQSPTLVLNRQGRTGNLNIKQIEDGLGTKINVSIPDMPKQLNDCASLGEPAVVAKGPFRQAISELAREVGFTASRDDDSLKKSRQPETFGGLFKVLGLQKG